MSNLYLNFPDFAVIEFCLLNSYPAVRLISSLIFSPGLKDTNNLESLLLLLGDCMFWDKLFYAVELDYFVINNPQF